MSQLIAVFGIEWKMLIIEMINFGILFAGLSYFLYKPVLKMLKDREEKIAQGVKDAEMAGVRMKEVEEEKTGILSKAHTEAEEAVSRGVEKGKTERAEIMARAQTQSDQMMKDAQLQAKEIERQAMKASEKEIAKVAVLAAEKLLMEK